MLNPFQHYMSDGGIGLLKERLKTVVS